MTAHTIDIRRKELASGGWTRILALSALLLLMVPGVVLPPSVMAAEPDVRLGIKPVGQGNAPYFRLTAEPGETTALTVALSNDGVEPIEVLTYVADAFTMPGGGFGIEPADAPRVGTSQWVTYPQETLTLQAGEVVTQSFTVTVPADARPGDYVTALAIQNVTPFAGSGSIALNQIIRQAVAIAISVPGPRTPMFTIDAVEHQLVGSRSVLTFSVANPGNMHLTPAGELVVYDTQQQEIHRSDVTMGRFYARTDTTLGVAFGQLLPAGSYLVTLALTDPATGASATFEMQPVTVPVVEVAPVLNADGTVTTPRQSNAPVVSDTAVSPLLLVAIGCFGLLVGVAATFAIVRRRGTRTSRTQAIVPQQ